MKLMKSVSIFFFKKTKKVGKIENKVRDSSDFKLGSKNSKFLFFLFFLLLTSNYDSLEVSILLLFSFGC